MRGAVLSIAKIGGKHVSKHSIVRLWNKFQIKQFQRLMFHDSNMVFDIYFKKLSQAKNFRLKHLTLNLLLCLG